MTNRQLRVWGFTLVAALGSLAIIEMPDLVLGAPTAAGSGQHLQIVVVTIAAAIAVLWAYVFAKKSFRSGDEFFRAAEKTSWYRGGLAGLFASVPVFAFVALGGLHWIDPATFGAGRALSMALAIGYLLPTSMQFAGFLAARTWWQISKR